MSNKPASEKTLVEIESEKPPLGNFTMSEYTEKVIQYGLMMVIMIHAAPVSFLSHMMHNSYNAQHTKRALMHFGATWVKITVLICAV